MNYRPYHPERNEKGGKNQQVGMFGLTIACRGSFSGEGIVLSGDRDNGVETSTA